jgi:hypothetical protein
MSIEWVPIKKFLKQDIDEDEEFLFYDKINSRAVTTSTDTIIREYLLQSFTHAAKINLPVEKTLEEKFNEHYCKNSNNPNLFKDFAQIAKEHYEGNSDSP